MIKKSGHIYGSSGFTLIEVMITVGIIGVISIGIVVALKFFIDLWQLGSARLELQQEAREAMYWIGQDFRNARASSMGNMGYNTGFEMPPGSPSEPPLRWQVPLPNGANRIGAGDPNVKSGFYGMKLGDISGAVNYESAASSFQFTGNYLLSGWIKSTGLAEIRLVKDSGLDFVPPVIIQTTGATVVWQKLSCVFNQNAGTLFKIRIANLNAGTEALFDDITISPVEVNFNPTTSNGQYLYEVLEEGRIKFRRLYYDSLNNRLYRQFFDGTNWQNEDPAPLCTKIKNMAIKDVNQSSFSVELTLAQRSRAGKEEEYSLTNTITPLSP